MIVHDFDIVRTFAPSKADAPLIIDLDAVLTRTIAAQRFQSIAGRHPQIIKPRHGIEQLQLPSRRALDRSEAPHCLVAEKTLGVPVGKAPDHTITLHRSRVFCQTEYAHRHPSVSLNSMRRFLA
jgi:hypothetical protein